MDDTSETASANTPKNELNDGPNDAVINEPNDTLDEEVHDKTNEIFQDKKVLADGISNKTPSEIERQEE